jgi:hypothetical protein
VFEELNDSQRAAAAHGGGPLLIVAGAGTGKTTALAARVAHLVERGVRPDGIRDMALDDARSCRVYAAQIDDEHELYQQRADHGCDILLQDTCVPDGEQHEVLQRVYFGSIREAVTEVQGGPFRQERPFSC